MRNEQPIDDYLRALDRVNQDISREAIDRAIEILYETWRSGGTVFTMGNGGSASTATHFTCDLAKSANAPGKRRLRAVCLVDNIPLVSAWANDSGFASIFAEQLEPWLVEVDALVGFSVHGGSGFGDAGPWSQNLGRAMALAKDRGAKIIGFSGFGGGAMKELADVCIVVPIDTEPFGTPLVESYHVVLHHLICTALKQRIAETEDE
jgi:phosphoheptose isomerase